MDTIASIVVPGAVPGAAEPGAGDQVGAATAAGPEQLQEEPGAHPRRLHQQPTEAAGDTVRGQGAAGLGAAERAGRGGGLQEEVSTDHQGHRSYSRGFLANPISVPLFRWGGSKHQGQGLTPLPWLWHNSLLC